MVRTELTGLQPKAWTRRDRNEWHVLKSTACAIIAAHERSGTGGGSGQLFFQLGPGRAGERRIWKTGTMLSRLVLLVSQMSTDDAVVEAEQVPDSRCSKTKQLSALTI
jgi:hypothetical protein